MQWQNNALEEQLALTVPASCEAVTSSDFSLCLLCRKPGVSDCCKYLCSAVSYLCLVFWNSLLHTAQQSYSCTKSVIPCTAASQTRCNVQLALTRPFVLSLPRALHCSVPQLIYGSTPSNSMCASAGFPWLPEKEQQAFEAAAAAASAPTNQEAATPAAAIVKSTASAAVQPLQLPKTLPGQQSQLEPHQAASLRHRDAANGSELSQFQHQQQAEPSKAAGLNQDSTAAKAAPEVSRASPTASGKAVSGGVREDAAQAETSPDAGRGSEGGVGPSHTIGSDTRDAHMLGGYSQAVPPPAERGALLSSDKKVGSMIFWNTFLCARLQVIVGASGHSGVLQHFRYS